MHKFLVIIGAGGHGQAVADLAAISEKWNRIAFVDDCYPEKREALGYEIIGKINSIYEGEMSDNFFVVAIGNNKTRSLLIEDINEAKLKLVSLIHPNAWVSKHATIGKGVAVMACAVVGTNAILGDGCLINANATVDHDCKLEVGAHLGVGVHLAGGVVVGKNAWLQAGSCAGYHVIVEPGVTIPTGVALSPNKQ
ncbi:MAG: acetyltransferase [Kangiellaceae bacterium]|nr:acetyltransferase [Kangiellaceae bacterium]